MYPTYQLQITDILKTKFIAYVPVMVTRYDDTLVRKIIQNVSVYDDHFVICFKSGIEMEV